MLRHSQSLFLLALAVPVALTCVACWTDIKRRTISNAIPIAIVAWAALATSLKWNAPLGWSGLALGLGLGIVVCVLSFASGGFGGGDAKLIGALGAVLGWQGLVVVVVLTAIAGGLLAILPRIRGERNYAYGPAIAAGMVSYCAIWLSVALMISARHR